MRKALLLLTLPFFWACSKNSVELETLGLKRANFLYFTLELPDSTGRLPTAHHDFKYQTNAPVEEIIVWENGLPVDTISNPEATAADMNHQPTWGKRYRFRARLENGTVISGAKTLPPKLRFRALDSVPPMKDTIKLYGAFKMNHRVGLVLEGLPTGKDSLTLSMQQERGNADPDLRLGAFLLKNKTFAAQRSFSVSNGDTLYVYSTRELQESVRFQLVGPDQARFRAEYERVQQLLNDDASSFLPASYSNLQGAIGIFSYYGYYLIPLE